jgi:hypothetical protein
MTTIFRSGPTALQAPQQGQRQIALQMALMEFVEHHAAHAREVRIAQHAPREHAFGEEAQARARSRHLLEAHLVAHRLAHALAALVRHVAGGQARGQAARLQHQHLAPIELQQRGRHARGLAGTGRCFQHQVVGGSQVLADCRE